MITLTDEQESAVQMANENPISILVGGPGVGKTTVTKQIVQAALDRRESISLCAPSGKAARRASEATNYPASTIHRLLEAKMEGGEFAFTRGEVTPLDCDLLICDETSMVSNDLMASLLRAVDADKTRVLFIGDQDQLPSISAGSVLRDFLNSKIIPTTELQKVFRNSGDIVKSCHKIKDGLKYAPSASLDPENGLNIRHIEEPNPKRIVQIIKKLVVDRMPARGFNPIWNVQVLSPTNTRTAMSCDGINKVLQDALNSSPAIKGTKFRPGDKAIQTKNEEIDGEYVVNGDLCEIASVTEKQITAKFFDPERIVTFPKSFNHLLLAYSITCHRFQGSEAPVIIIPIHKSFSFIVNRPWIYTAISRAREICITVGQFRAVEMAIKKEVSGIRKTMLRKKICA
jgi:exodeoxyribonuclease V alpha subunit